MNLSTYCQKSNLKVNRGRYYHSFFKDNIFQFKIKNEELQNFLKNINKNEHI